MSVLAPKCELKCSLQGGAGNPAQKELSRLFGSTATFYHPSNHGRWQVAGSLPVPATSRLPANGAAALPASAFVYRRV